MEEGGIDPDIGAGEDLNRHEKFHELQDRIDDVDNDGTANIHGIIGEGAFLDDVKLFEEDHDLPTIMSADNFTEDDSFTVEPPLEEENRYEDYADNIGNETHFHLNELPSLSLIALIVSTLK